MILQDVADGKVDIVVGTHKLLSSDIKFKDLGLLIVDEEHRFGVRQKRKSKRCAPMWTFLPNGNADSSYAEHGNEWYA